MQRAHIHMPMNIGDKVADAVTGSMGSWKFITIQTAIVLLWMIGNVYLLTRPFDPFPFILLNLVFSTQAAYASPLILMSQNRTAAKDRQRDDLEASEVDQLTSMNKQQLTILEQEQGIKLQVEEMHTRIDHLEQLLLEQNVNILSIMQHLEGRGGKP